jgi:hypothetical protein
MLITDQVDLAAVYYICIQEVLSWILARISVVLSEVLGVYAEIVPQIDHEQFIPNPF